MKHVAITLFALAFAFSAQAATTKTTVNGTITLPGGPIGLAGSCTISARTSWTAAGGERITRGPLSTPVTVTDGAFTVDLIPGDTAIGGPQDYDWSCALRRGAGGRYERAGPWIVRVPTSETPVEFKDIVITSPAGSNYTVQLGQIAAGGAATGNLLRWNGTGWTPPPDVFIDTDGNFVTGSTVSCAGQANTVCADYVRVLGVIPAGPGPDKINLRQGTCPGTADAGFDYTLCIESDKLYKVSAAGVKTLAVTLAEMGPDLSQAFYNNPGTTVNQGTTLYGGMTGSLSSDANTDSPVIKAGTVTGLRIKNGVTMVGVTGPLTVTVRVNGVDTSITASIPGGSTVNTQAADTAHSAAVAVGDRIGYKVSCGAGTGNCQGVQLAITIL